MVLCTYVGMWRLSYRASVSFFVIQRSVSDEESGLLSFLFFKNLAIYLFRFLAGLGMTGGAARNNSRIKNDGNASYRVECISLCHSERSEESGFCYLIVF